MSISLLIVAFVLLCFSHPVYTSIAGEKGEAVSGQLNIMVDDMKFLSRSRTKWIKRVAGVERSNNWHSVIVV